MKNKKLENVLISTAGVFSGIIFPAICVLFDKIGIVVFFLFLTLCSFVAAKVYIERYGFTICLKICVGFAIVSGIVSLISILY